MSERRLVGLLVVLAMSAVALADDWPQWRGPRRSGVAADSPALVDAFGEGGPKKVWESEPLHGPGGGGYGSVAVADGRAYVFADWGYNVPKEERIFEKGHLRNHGYLPDIPAELSKQIEAARTSEERKKLDRRAVNPWVETWLKKNITKETRKYRGAAQARLRAGEKAVPLDVLAKLTPIVDKPFPNQTTLETWFKNNDIDDATMREATKWVRKTTPLSKDFLVCLDAKTGKTLWKTEVPSRAGQTHEASGTPAVADGRVYAVTASSTVVCLDATTGRKVWEKTPFGKPTPVHSSVLVADGVVVVSANGTVGLDAQTGEALWKAKRLYANNSSPVAWASGGKTFALINSRQLTCLDIKSGEVAWKVPGGGSATPAIAGDYLAGLLRKKLVVYKLAAEKAEKLWTMAFKEDYASPVIFKDHVYAIGAPGGKKEGRAVCVELTTGKVKWDAPVPGAPNCASPLVADGKLVTYAKGELLLAKASPGAYAELARAKIGGNGWSSPALVDGKLFCRIVSKVFCYDLAK